MSESTRLERMVMACAAGAMAAESDEHGTWGNDHEAFAGHVLKRAKALDDMLAREKAPGVFPTFPADATDEEIERASEPKKTDDAPTADVRERADRVAAELCRLGWFAQSGPNDAKPGRTRMGVYVATISDEEELHLARVRISFHDVDAHDRPCMGPRAIAEGIHRGEGRRALAWAETRGTIAKAERRKPSVEERPQEPNASHANEVENLRRMLDTSNRALAECHKTLDTLDAILGRNGNVCTTDAARRLRDAHERAFDGIVALLNELSPQPFAAANVDDALAALGEWCRNAKSNRAQADPTASQEPTDEQIAREAAEYANYIVGIPAEDRDVEIAMRAIRATRSDSPGAWPLIVRAYAAGRKATSTEQKREGSSEDPIAHLRSCGGLRDRKLPTGHSMLLVLFESSEMVVCPGCRRVLKDRHGAWPRPGTDCDRPGFTLSLVVSFPPSYRMEVAVREAGVDELIHRTTIVAPPV